MKTEKILKTLKEILLGVELECSVKLKMYAKNMDGLGEMSVYKSNDEIEDADKMHISVCVVRTRKHVPGMSHHTLIVLLIRRR